MWLAKSRTNDWRAAASDSHRQEDTIMRADTRGNIRTQTVETPVDSNGGDAVPAATEGVGFDWNNWLNAWLDNERSVMIPWFERQLTKFSDELFDLIGPRLKKISELELKLAKLEGALDVLRGRGAPGAFNVRGTYDPGASYNYLDVVACDGGSFVALRDGPGPCPGDGWQQLAGVGRRGQRGWRGPQGERGADAPVWSGVSFDPKMLSFTTRLSDGSLGPTISLKHIFAGVDVDAASYSVSFKLLDGTELNFSLRGLFERFFHEFEGR
jgi:hypothetical protein